MTVTAGKPADHALEATITAATGFLADAARAAAGLPEPLRITVRAKPAPQGSKTALRGANGRVNLVESSKGVKPFREAVRAETQRLAPVVLTGPVAVRVVFWMVRPKSHWRTGKNSALLKADAPRYPVAMGRDDIDKLCRAVLDGLTAGGAWLDDAQVVILDAEKRYGSVPGVDITVRNLARSAAPAAARSSAHANQQNPTSDGD